MDVINKINEINNKNEFTEITIKTKLFDHQLETTNNILTKIKTDDKKGFGDASMVGSGKTLTALNTMKEINNYQIKNKLISHYGFLVLVPTEKLFQTWIDEINKHTSGFNIILQNSKGNHDKVTSNSIFITTLGRMRDHPIYHNWSFVIIDECLSVQNQNALQTEEAWRQVCSSLFGVLMMSATFFRSRFDKLFYMLKMLRTNLPCEKDYLDTILSTTISCFISDTNRKWTTNITKFKMNDQQYKNYEKIKLSNKTDEMKYSELASFIHQNINYISFFESKIKELKNKKCLIYAKSTKEADEIAKFKNVSRYPDKSKQHGVLTITEGTYGLNDLVIYDTLLLRIPEPDKLPQIKGRLDRPGQLKNELTIEFILVENTIEEANIQRLNMCNYFYKNYIMPISEFYSHAVKI